LDDNPALVCYAVKANGNPAIIRLLGEWGMGADVTSGGELFLAQHAGIPADKIIYSGVGKLEHEIEAAINAGVRALHVESEMEMHLIGEVAARVGRKTAVGIRINPNIYAKPHPHISTGTHAHKFGVTWEVGRRLYQFAADHAWLTPVGMAVHIGSQIQDVEPYVKAAHFLVEMADSLAADGIRLHYLDIGGGLGINYDEPFASPQQLILEWKTAVSAPILNAGYKLVMEPGRSVVGTTGALLTSVVYTKKQGGKTFVIGDAAMNDLLRPSLYDAVHPLLPIKQADGKTNTLIDLVGPVCESTDCLAKKRPFPLPERGDQIALMHAGGYGFSMASNYNGRLKPTELLINGADIRLIRARETVEALL
jgi:diaminopimelate decarboxylase